MGWFKGKKSKSGASTEDEGPEVSSYSPELPERQKSKLVHATSIQNFASIKSPEATIMGGRNEVGPKPANYPARMPIPSSQPVPNGPANPGAGLRPISTIPAPSSNTGSSEISVATPVQPADANAAAAALNSSMDSMGVSSGANGYFQAKEGVKGKGSYMQQQQQRILELEDEVTKLQQELAACDSARINAEQEANSKNAQVQSLMKQLTDITSSPNSKDAEAAEAENQRSSDDLHAALKAFREQSQSKLADTLRQNQELRYQVENYEAMCRTIGEVLRDYEWLQQCRIVTGDLDLGRLRKSMMKLWHSGKTRSVLPVLAMVLAFGPDDVQRCRSVISTAKQEADMVCYIPEIIEHNMDENMKRDAITIYIEAHKSQTEDTDIAMFLTDKFAEKYKGEWHSVVGEQYALSSCYESKVIKFKSGHRSIILWSN